MSSTGHPRPWGGGQHGGPLEVWAWKAELSRDIELLRQEMGPQLVDVEGLPDFERLAAGVFVPAEARGASSAVGACAGCSRSSDLQLRRIRCCLQQAPGPSCPVCKADFRSRPRVVQHLEVGAQRCVLAWKSGAFEPFSDDAVAAADQQDCAHSKREGRSHLAGPPMLRGGAEGQ